MGFKKVEEKDKKWGHVFRVGNSTGSYDIKSKYPDIDYTKLTNDDFVTSFESDNSSYYTDWDNKIDDDDYFIMKVQAGAISVNKNYNPSTGMLSVSMGGYPFAYTLNEEDRGDRWQYGSFSGLKIAIYMIVDGIRSQYT